MIQGDGAFVFDQAYRISAITDGLSNTMFVGEMSRFNNDPDSFFNFWNRGGYFGARSPLTPGVTRPQASASTAPRLNSSLIIPDAPADISMGPNYVDSWLYASPGQALNEGQYAFEACTLAVRTFSSATGRSGSSRTPSIWETMPL